MFEVEELGGRQKLDGKKKTKDRWVTHVGV